jgi:hypothetical protein
MTEKEKKQAIIVGALAPFLLLLLFMNMNKKTRYQAAVMQNAATTSGGTGSVSEIITEFDANVKLIANKEINDSLERVMGEKVLEGWERHPFEILVSTQNMTDTLDAQAGIQKSNEPLFTVSGIVYDSNPDNVAVIIDGDFYHIGDKIDNWLIVNVEAESVYFKRGETEYIFNLYEK